MPGNEKRLFHSGECYFWKKDQKYIFFPKMTEALEGPTTTVVVVAAVPYLPLLRLFLSILRPHLTGEEVLGRAQPNSAEEKVWHGTAVAAQAAESSPPPPEATAAAAGGDLSIRVVVIGHRRAVVFTFCVNTLLYFLSLSRERERESLTLLLSLLSVCVSLSLFVSLSLSLFLSLSLSLAFPISSKSE